MPAIPSNLAELSDDQLGALCVWREARGSSPAAKQGVANVIANRVARPSWWGHDIRSVILKPYQFSSFLASDPNSSKWPEDDAVWALCQEAWDARDHDTVSGATFYYSIPISRVPTWAAVYEFIVKIDNILFYKDR